MWRLKYLKTLLRNLMLPPAGPLLLAIAGALLLRRRPRLARVLLTVGLGSLWLFTLPVVADALTRLASHFPPLDIWGSVRRAVAARAAGLWRLHRPSKRTAAAGHGQRYRGLCDARDAGA